VIDALILALALAMDATAVSAACGAAGIARAITFRMAWLFAVFHIAMCSLGWLIGEVADDWVSTWDHWLAFGLLAVIGGKMTWSAMRSEPVEVPASWSVLLGLAVATSIDAVAAGVTLPLVDVPELVTIGAVGGTVFVFVMVGAAIGAHLGARFGRAFQIAGGVAIIGLGVKIVVEHVA
jgi:putative Mn2+ efflux pump MntP